MSINIALIPLALVMYVVMGEKRFNEWARSGELVKYTSVKSFKIIQRYLRQAGYDFQEVYGIQKTHFAGRNWFSWEIRNGYVCAVFSKYDSMTDISNFIKNVENAIGKKTFFGSLEEITDVHFVRTRTEKIMPVAQKEVQVVKEVIKPKPITEQVFDTKFADKNLLIKALKSIGLNCIETGNDIKCSSDNYTLIFTNNGTNYQFKIVGDVTEKDAYQKYKDVDLRYERLVQQEVVENVKKKVTKSPTMQLQQEQVLEDNSVLLTIRV